MRAANANPSRVSGPATPPGKGRARPLDAPSGPGERVAGIRHACPGRSGSTPPVHPATGPRLTRALPVQSTPLRSPLSMRSAIPDCPVHHVKLLSGPCRPLPRPHRLLPGSPVHAARCPVHTTRSRSTVPTPQSRPPAPRPHRPVQAQAAGSRSPVQALDSTPPAPPKDYNSHNTPLPPPGFRCCAVSGADRNPESGSDPALHIPKAGKARAPRPPPAPARAASAGHPRPAAPARPGPACRPRPRPARRPPRSIRHAACSLLQSPAAGTVGDRSQNPAGFPGAAPGSPCAPPARPPVAAGPAAGPAARRPPHPGRPAGSRRGAGAALARGRGAGGPPPPGPRPAVPPPGALVAEGPS